MATKLFLRNTTANGITDTGDGILYDMLIAAGASVDTAETATTAGGTDIQATKTAGGSTIAWISGRAPAGGFTLTTTDISMWQIENHMNANVGGRFRVFKRTAAGSVVELGGGPFDDGIEMSTGDREDTWVGNVTDTAFAEDDRILVRYYITNVGTMGDQGCVAKFNAADASTGDSFFNIAQTVTFKPESGAEFAAAVSGVASVAAALTTVITLAAALSGTATLAGDLTTEITPAASVTATGTVAGDLTTEIRLAGAVSGVATVAADLTISEQALLEGSISGVATVAGGLTTEITAAASVSGSATVAGALTTEITLAANAVGTCSIAGDLTTAGAGPSLCVWIQ